MRVTCPESAHLEAIEYAVHRRRLRVIACSTAPGCPVTCARTCETLLSRKLASRLLEIGSVLTVRSCLR
jgi:hypothetical protein